MSDLTMIDDLFLQFYPGGLNDERFIEISKKHKANIRVTRLIEEFDVEMLLEEYPPIVKNNIQLITKMVTSCTMISVFEKVAFKNYISDHRLHYTFLEGLYNLITKCNKRSFEDFASILSMRKNEDNCNTAKWPIITFFMIFFNPQKEVFIKPTTIKNVARLLDYDIEYQPTLNYNTYTKVKKMIIEYKKSSSIVKKADNINVQAVMYCALNL